MDKIIEIISNTFIAKLFIKLGLDEEISSILAVIVTMVIIYLIRLSGKFLLLQYKTSKASKDLAPFYSIKTPESKKHYIKYFIHTRGQDKSPDYEEKPKNRNNKKLIPWLIDNVFQDKKESDKYHLILADSGMGKTTFLINLYLKYNSFFNFKFKYKVKMLPLGTNDIIQRIKRIVDDQDTAANTILLLDAFDEYKGLRPPENPDELTDDERFREQFDYIAEITKDFRKVIITSRTQFFPAQKEGTLELKIPRFDKIGFHELSVQYISPFDEKEIKKFLNKRYGIFKIWNFKKKRIAKKITKNSHTLMIRPLLLSYLEYLTKEYKIYKNTFDIYDTLVNNWIETEAKKRKAENAIRKKFESDLLAFSKFVAFEMCEKKEYSQGIKKEVAQTIRSHNNLNLENYEITGRSLLIRDIDSNWKFAHKSIYEFFIAQRAFNEISFCLSLDIISLDMIEKFINEKDDANAYYYMGSAYYKKNNYDKAFEYYEKAIELELDNSEAFFNIGNAYYNTGNYGNAFEYYKRAIELNLDNPEAYFNIGNAYYDKCYYDEAIECYEKAIELKPDYADAYYYLGNAYCVENNYGKAIESYKKAIEFNPDNTDAYYYLGNTYNETRNYQNAIICYIKAIELNPEYEKYVDLFDNPKAYYHMINAYCEKDNYDKAIVYYEKAIKIKPKYSDYQRNNRHFEFKLDNPAAYFNMGNAYYDKCYYDKAIECYKKTINLQPNYADAYSNMGNAYYKQGHYDKVIKCYEKIVEFKRDNPEAYFHVGNAYLKKRQL